MSDGSLTQEEIDLLLQGADNFGGESREGNGILNDALGQAEVDQITGMFHQGFQAGIPGLSQILARNVRIGHPAPTVVTQADLEREQGTGYAFLRLKINGSLGSRIAITLPVQDAARIADVIMGGDGSVDPQASTLDSAQIATIKDTLSPFLFNSLNRVSVRIGVPITPQISDMIVSGQGGQFPIKEDTAYLKLRASIVVEGLLESSIYLILPVRVAHTMSRMAENQSVRAPRGDGASSSEHSSSADETAIVHSDVKEVQFPLFNATGSGPTSPNMNLLMDVQMTLTVELGRTRMYIKDILGLGEGSIIELDKLAGEPVDLLVNGKLIAKGEVVVIDENFGVRVTDIVSPVDRLRSQKQQPAEG